jgi:hypothetical protein
VVRERDVMRARLGFPRVFSSATIFLARKDIVTVDLEAGKVVAEVADAAVVSCLLLPVLLGWKEFLADAIVNCELSR